MLTTQNLLEDINWKIVHVCTGAEGEVGTFEILFIYNQVKSQFLASNISNYK